MTSPQAPLNLLPCPFCGKPPMTECKIDGMVCCGAHTELMWPDEWNNRSAAPSAPVAPEAVKLAYGIINEFGHKREDRLRMTQHDLLTLAKAVVSLAAVSGQGDKRLSGLSQSGGGDGGQSTLENGK